MDRRSWPWKKKSSEKAITTSDSVGASLSNIGVKQGGQEHMKPLSLVQISLEKYEHLNGLEDQVEVLHDKLNDLKEKLSLAQAEKNTKDDLVKQHAKVAEEAISGWEKAEAETFALKHQLESVTLLKLTAEERAAYLDSAMKECMKQILNVKEEGDQKLHDVLFAKTKLWEKDKSELEATIAGFEGELLKSSAETEALSRSLRERSTLLMKISQEKSKADAEMEILKANIQAYAKEVSSLKYELHVAAKELEIRNEEKKMSTKSAEVANKQHIEDAKKITKLEAELQRLRGLVRKRLPGPAALAQMKLEVESLGQDFGESRVRRQSGKSSSTYPALVPEVALTEVEHCHKENEFLTARLLAMEEKTKLLKEALSKRNNEVQASRSTCAKMANKLRSLEALMLLVNQRKSSLKSEDIFLEGSLSKNGSNQRSTSMSEDSYDNEGTHAWASTLMSVQSQFTKEKDEQSQFKKEKDSDRKSIAHNPNQMEFMDDFLEMERLAGLSSERNGVVTTSDEMLDKMKSENYLDTSSVDVHMDVCKEQTRDLQHQSFDLLNETHPSGTLLSNIHACIASVVESKVLDAEMRKFLKKIMRIVQYAQAELPFHSNGHLTVEAQCCVGEGADCETSLKQDDNSCSEVLSVNQELSSSISRIHDFVLSLCNEATKAKSTEGQVASAKVEESSDSINKPLCKTLKLDSSIHSLYHVLSETKELRLESWDMEENYNTDCIDKVTLLENGVASHDPMKCKLFGSNDRSPRASDPEFAEGPTNPISKWKTTPQCFSFEEFESLKIERENLAVDLAKCQEILEHTKRQLAETEENLAELKLQLCSRRKESDLAETQLKCMTESYKLLESHAHELETQISLLKSKAEALDSELNAERHGHQNVLAKYNDLEEQLRNTSCSECSRHSEADVGIKARQEREVAEAVEKLTECQETIAVLSKQLNALCPAVEPTSMSRQFREKPSMFSDDSQPSHCPAAESNAVSTPFDVGVEGSLDEWTSQLSTSDMESSPTLKSAAFKKQQRHHSRSASASSLSSMMNEKQGRSFSRFFLKGKS